MTIDAETRLAKIAAMQQRLRKRLPIIEALSIELADYDGQTLKMHLPLAKNMNDKDTAFAGSIASAAALSGWALVKLATEEAWGEVDVAIYKAELDYIRPIVKDFWGEPVLPLEPFELLVESLDHKSKGRIELDVAVNDVDGVAARLHGAYAVRKATPTL